VLGEKTAHMFDRRARADVVLDQRCRKIHQLEVGIPARLTEVEGCTRKHEITPGVEIHLGAVFDNGAFEIKLQPCTGFRRLLLEKTLKKIPQTLAAHVIELQFGIDKPPFFFTARRRLIGNLEVAAVDFQRVQVETEFTVLLF
jgi:hypothetical protein